MEGRGVRAMRKEVELSRKSFSAFVPKSRIGNMEGHGVGGEKKKVEKTFSHFVPGLRISNIEGRDVLGCRDRKSSSLCSPLMLHMQVQGAIDEPDLPTAARTRGFPSFSPAPPRRRGKLQ